MEIGQQIDSGIASQGSKPLNPLQYSSPSLEHEQVCIRESVQNAEPMCHSQNALPHQQATQNKKRSAFRAPALTRPNDTQPPAGIEGPQDPGNWIWFSAEPELQLTARKCAIPDSYFSEVEYTKACCLAIQEDLHLRSLLLLDPLPLLN